MTSEQAYEMGIEQLVDTYGEKVFRHAYHILHDDALAEDVTQMTFENFCRNTHLLRQGSEISSWVYRIATHAAVNIIRKRIRSPMDNAVGIGSVAYMLSTGHPESAYIRHIDGLRFLDTLSRKDRDLVTLSQDGYRYDEISDILELPQGTVKRKMYRIRLKAQNFMNGNKHGAVSRESAGG